MTGLFVALSILMSDGMGQAPAPSLAANERITITFRAEPTLEAAIGAVCRAAGITCQVDASVGTAVRNSTIGPAPVAISNASIEDALDFLTTRGGLAYTVVDSQTVRVHRQAR